MKSVLVIEDEERVRELICHHLEKEGFKPVQAPDAETALENIRHKVPDAILLDLMLPGGMQGIELCRVLRKQERTQGVPILILTARTDEYDKLLLFELGVDDYMTKPFSPRELVARLRAVLRRLGYGHGTKDGQSYECGPLYMNFASYEVRVRGNPVQISNVEFRLLKHFVTHAERVYSRDQLLEFVWGLDTPVKPRTVDVHIQKLRTLIEDDPTDPKMIVTVRGMGYKFQPAP